MTQEKKLKVCKEGHLFYKSGDCPACPICEKLKKPEAGFLSTLPAPARRALENNDINTLTALARYSAADLLKLHGFGPAALPKLRAALQAKGLKLKGE